MTPHRPHVRVLMLTIAAAVLAIVACGSEEGTRSSGADATDVDGTEGDVRRPDLLGGSDLPITPDAADGDLSADSEGDAADRGTDGGEGDTSGGDDATDASLDPIDVAEDPVFEPVDFASLDLELLTEGGFTGMGGTDYQLADWELTVYMPFATPFECSALLTAPQQNRLLDAASRVDWAGLAASYRPLDNPDCCCDQIIYDLTAMATGQSGDIEAQTDWCDASILPEALSAFTATLREVGDEVFATCEE